MNKIFAYFHFPHQSIIYKFTCTLNYSSFLKKKIFFPKIFDGRIFLENFFKRKFKKRKIKQIKRLNELK